MMSESEGASAQDAQLTDARTIAAAFRRLMRARIDLGMFDPPLLSSWNEVGLDKLRSDAHTALNRRVAASGITLLQNKNGPDGKPLLPLSLAQFKGKQGSISVAGPVADNGPNTLGNYDCGYNDWVRNNCFVSKVQNSVLTKDCSCWIELHTARVREQ